MVCHVGSSLSARAALVAIGMLLAAAAGSTQPAWAAEACPNEALRTGASALLPDCRAYELVSPSDPHGLVPTARRGATNGFSSSYVDPLGRSIMFYIFGGAYEGTEANGVNDQYEATRVPGLGWQTNLVGPTGAQSEVGALGGLALGHSSWFYETGGSAFDFGSLNLTGSDDYVRQPNGVYEPIGRGSLGDDLHAHGRWITPDASHIIFSTGFVAGGLEPVQLEPNAPPPPIAAIYDRSQGGPTYVVSLLPNNLAPSANSFYRGASPNGTAILFEITEEGVSTLYERRNNATTIPVVQGNATFEGVSGDGEHVFYRLGESLVSFDATTESPALIANEGAPAVVNISEDGSHVYFISSAVLTGSEETGNGEAATPGSQNLYVWQEGSVHLVGILAEEDVTGFVSLTTWAESVAPGMEAAWDPSRSTEDGAILAFESRAMLTSYDNGGHVEIYRYDAVAGTVECVSCKPNGGAATTDAKLEDVANGLAPTGGGTLISNLTSDGSRVFFETAEQLLPQDTDQSQDIYEWNDGHISLISSASGTGVNYLYGMTPDGKDVVFRTTDALVPQDHTEGVGALYDARVGGGFSTPTDSIPCEEEACQGIAAMSSQSRVSGTTSLAGGGNVKRRRCGRGKRRIKRHGHVRCVKKRHVKSHRQRRQRIAGGAK